MSVLIPGLMALLGADQAEVQRKNDIIDNELQSELTRYSHLTGKSGNIHKVGGGFFEGAMKGGASGLSLMQGMGDLGSKGKSSFDASSYDTNQSTRLEAPTIGAEYSPRDTGYLGASTGSLGNSAYMPESHAAVGSLDADYLRPDSRYFNDTDESLYNQLGASDSDLSRLYRAKYLNRG